MANKNKQMLIPATTIYHRKRLLFHHREREKIPGIPLVRVISYCRVSTMDLKET
jgi:hypothetical protein